MTIITNIVGLRELRENIDKYIKMVHEGKSFTVVRRSKPVFKIAPVDVWGDEGVWEEVVDFTDIDKKGIEVDFLIGEIEKING